VGPIRLLLSSSLGLFTLATSASAQLTITDNRFYYGALAVGGNYVAYTYLDEVSPFASMDASTGVVTCGFTDQFSSQLLRNQITNASGYEESLTSFSVGAHPVSMTDIVYTANARLIHGGGKGTNPTENVSVGFFVSQFDDGNGNGRFDVGEPVYGPGFSAAQAWPTISGNGYWDMKYQSSPGSYVLSAHSNYVLGTLMYTNISQEALTIDTPTVTTTHENFYNGVTFHAQALPEPSTWAALGLGTVALLRRRKRA